MKNLGFDRMRWLGYGVLFVCLGINVGCTRKTENSTLKLKIPAAQSGSNFSHNTSFADSSPFSGSVNTFSEVNCYGVFVGGLSSETQMNRHSCKSTDNSVAFTFGYFMVGVPATGEEQEISLELPAGTSEYVHLVAMHANAGSCFLYGGTVGPPEGQVTHPRIVDYQVVDLVEGSDVFAKFQMPNDLTALTEIEDCDIGGDSNSDDDGEPSIDPATALADVFGDGRDGSIAPDDTTTYLNFNAGDTIDDSGAMPYTPASGGTDGTTKYVSASRSVTNISADGKTLTLDSSISNLEFEPGDLVLFHVSSGWASTSPDTNACGADLYRGKWDTSRISSATTLDITLEDAITADPTTANLNLGNSLIFGSDHCTIQVIRVPEFDTIQVVGGETLSISTANNFGFSGNYGGIVALKVKDLQVDGVFDINAEQRGYLSGSVGTYGIAGGSGSDTIAENGGAYSTTSGFGGGGGQAGRGSDANYTETVGGNALTYCGGSTACAGFIDYKAFMGGSGGGNGSTAGGNGGGIVFLFAEKVSGSGTISITANGAISPAVGGGGGAGGSVSFVARETNGTVGITMTANGGNGNGDGGDGGGGSVDATRCSAYAGSVTITMNADPGNATTTIQDEAEAGLTKTANLEDLMSVLCD
tara:strand:- start:148910 stop:150841 length:1932 start_codon:yes stop_codon:yes gene_type:complete